MSLTLALIKPDAVQRNLIGNIITLIEKNDFIIKDIKLMKMSKKIAQEFYSCHKEKSFYDNLITYMTSGEIVALILEKHNAVTSYRNLIGSTDPSPVQVVGFGTTAFTTTKLFVLTNELDGLVHASDISWNESGENAIKNYEINQPIKSKIIDYIKTKKSLFYRI